ncbi:MAG: hypothetical protein AAB794_01910 [Patescibacteria group bacterium]
MQFFRSLWKAASGVLDAVGSAFEEMLEEMDKSSRPVGFQPGSTPDELDSFEGWK